MVLDDDDQNNHCIDVTAGLGKQRQLDEGTEVMSFRVNECCCCLFEVVEQFELLVVRE